MDPDSGEVVDHGNPAEIDVEIAQPEVGGQVFVEL